MGKEEENCKLNMMDVSMMMVTIEMKMEVVKCKVNMSGMTIMTNQLAGDL